MKFQKGDRVVKTKEFKGANTAPVGAAGEIVFIVESQRPDSVGNFNVRILYDDNLFMSAIGYYESEMDHFELEKSYLVVE